MLASKELGWPKFGQLHSAVKTMDRFKTNFYNISPSTGREKICNLCKLWGIIHRLAWMLLFKAPCDSIRRVVMVSCIASRWGRKGVAVTQLWITHPHWHWFLPALSVCTLLYFVSLDLSCAIVIIPNRVKTCLVFSDSLSHSPAYPLLRTSRHLNFPTWTTRSDKTDSNIVLS